jgi:GGDEF domain-containing protein
LKLKQQLEIEAVKCRINTGQNISFSIGYADRESHPQASLEGLMQLADQQMYQEKREYYSRPGNNRLGRSSR